MESLRIYKRTFVVSVAIVSCGSVMVFLLINSHDILKKPIKENAMLTQTTESFSKTSENPPYTFPKNDTADLGIFSPINDFKSFPCALGQDKEIIVSSHRTCIRTVSEHVEETPHNQCVTLRYTGVGVTSPICIYASSVDIYVSKDIRNSGHWEHGLVTNLMQYMLANPGLEFLDVGCNIGVYTIVAAKLGKRVVCIDPIVPNVMMVSTSLKMGKIKPNVTIIWNAVSDTRRLVSLQRVGPNVGGTEIRDNVAGKSELAEAITMDDLLPFFKGKEIVMKMDIQEHELYALRGGEEFFRQVDVKLIQIEYHINRNRPSGLQIADLMEGRGFRPYKDIKGSVPLNKGSIKRWPVDIYFIKNKNQTSGEQGTSQ